MSNSMKNEDHMPGIIIDYYLSMYRVWELSIWVGVAL
jgi:hypothetical protein